MSLAAYWKRLWARALLRGVHYRDRHKQLDILYSVPDPWGLDCDQEKARFAATNHIISREFGPVASILEIGCGEGLQSEYLLNVCDRLTGIDISRRAVARAKVRCPTASFLAGDILSGGANGIEGRPQLVVACEVLYYVGAVQDFLDRMSALGDMCLVTYHAPKRAQLEAEISAGRNVQSELFRFADTEWVISWWTNTGAPQ